MKNVNLCAIIVILTVLRFIKCLTIDNQLKVIKNDCYERLAIGEKLHSRDVDHLLSFNTVQDCQLACTKEQEQCRSFSFGIGVKGNGTCELSKKVIKETPDLKPIGTIKDIEFDLYIKKLGCKLVLNKDPLSNIKPTSQIPSIFNPQPSHPEKPIITNPVSNYGASQHLESNYNSHRPSPPIGPNHFSDRPIRVQSTLISVASNPNSPQSPNLEQPKHERFPDYGTGRPYYPNKFNRPDFDEPPNYYYDFLNNRPPFRPPFLNHPYDRIPLDYYDEPERYPKRPFPNDRSDSRVYGEGSRPNRPNRIPERPIVDEYDNPNFISRPRPKPESLYIYGNRPERPFFNDRPMIENYRPNDDFHKRPSNHYQSKPHRPEIVPEKPVSEPPSETEYYGSKPFRPNKVPERPATHSDGYGDEQRPNRPDYVPSRPTGDDAVYGPESFRPDYIPARPISNRPPSHDNINYGEPLRPQRPHQVPPRPFGDSDDYSSRPQRPSHIPERPFDDYGSKPQRPIYGGNRPRPVDFADGRPPSAGYDGEAKPSRPTKIPQRPSLDSYDQGPRPHRPENIPERPVDDLDGYNSRPHRPDYIPDRPTSDLYIYNTRPHRPNRIPVHRPSYVPENPDEYSYGYGRPYYPVKRPNDERPYHYRNFDSPPNSSATRRIDSASFINDLSNVTPKIANSSNDLESNKLNKVNGSVIKETNGPHGETITAILTEIFDACFRRVLAGKRVSRNFVRKAVPCERLEDCQRECSEEKRFVCEGFSYRLDPSGRGQGDCELIEFPLSHFDIRRDVYSDPDYDYYERDRNNKAPDCDKEYKYYNRDSSYGGRDYYHSDRRYDYQDNRRRYDSYDDSYWNRGGSKYPRPEGHDSGFYNNRRGGKNYNHHYNRDDYDDKHYDYNYKRDHFDGRKDYDYERPPNNDYYHDRIPHHNYDYKPSYPPPPYDYKSYEPYQPHGNWKYERPFYGSNGQWDKYFEDRMKDRNHWGFNDHHKSWGSYGGSYGNFGAPDSFYAYDHYDDRHRNNNQHYDYHDKKYFYVPFDNGGSKDWGHYGGSYGGYNSKHHQHKDSSYDYWGFNKLNGYGNDYGPLLPPYQEKPELNGNYLPPYDERFDYFGIQPYNPHEHGYVDYQGDGQFGHDDHGYFGQREHGHVGHHQHGQFDYGHDYNNFLKNECSLRTVTGFRLHKGIIKKLIAVSNIYECELLCFNERDFQCNSYAFRYTSIPTATPENCYLSDRDYKELDYYTDLEPDRDCDIYTMNNQNSCGQSTHLDKYNSDCFWRIRSGQRLDQRIVRDSLNVKSIIECQLECLGSSRFTCRAFSFRYGSPHLGGAIDNCQLTDWPYVDLDPRIHLVPEHGFELYERGSYGHGCEPNHFLIGSKPGHNSAEKLDQLCYIGYGSPARLLPQATKKSLRVETEAECKVECSQAREKSLFQCMSLSYRTAASKNTPNCDLSDIVQRDLLSNVDYVPDSDSWLFAWDIHNPRCIGPNGIGGGSGIFGGGGGHEAGNSIGGQNVIGGDFHNHRNGILNSWFMPGYTWRIYSVGGLPCKRGSLCQENKVAGFWYCELEGREEHAWDYCCRPDHQCGNSEGFPYQWCYVGPGRTQWRKCNDRYYPYSSNVHDRFDQQTSSYQPIGQSWAPPVNPPGSNHVGDQQPLNKPNFRPDRPPPPSESNLHDYDPQFNNHFLDPPKPGGFGQSRHWPLSYLHKEMPPTGNDSIASSDSKFDYIKTPKSRNIDSKYDAIANLIDVIKSNDLKNQYQITNSSNNPDDTLYVQIPLPTSISSANKSEKLKLNDTTYIDKLEAVNLVYPKHEPNLRENRNAPDRKARVYTRSYITKTNRTAISNQRGSHQLSGFVDLLP